MAFVQRLLTFNLNLANGNFSGGGNSLTLAGLRASCNIEVMGKESSGKMSAAIYGLTLSQMNQLTSLGKQFKGMTDNTVTVMAGDGDGNGNPVGTQTMVFSGHIYNTWMDGQAQPQVPFRIEATSDGLQRVKPAPSTSVRGTGDVAQMMSNLAQTMGFSFENNGVNVKLSNHYSWGSPRRQAMEIAHAAGIEHVVDLGTLAIWMPGKARQGGPTLISPQTGMIGYPAFYAASVIVKTLFNPAIKFGQDIQVQSSIAAANGLWNIHKLELELDSLMPHGRWFQAIAAYDKGSPPPPP
jgi:hypothetical protein